MQLQEGLPQPCLHACRVHALNLDSGSDATSPVDITATVAFPAWQTNITFDAAVQSQRAGLALSDGILYVAFGGHCTASASYPWVFGFNARCDTAACTPLQHRRNGLLLLLIRTILQKRVGPRHF